MTMTAHLPVSAAPRLSHSGIVGSRGPALVAVWVSTAILLAATPGLVPDSLNERMPLVLVSCALWAMLATGCLALTPRRCGLAQWNAAVAAIWLLVLAGGSLFPEAGPESAAGIPPLLVIGPPVAALLTCIVCLRQATKT